MSCRHIVIYGRYGDVLRAYRDIWQALAVALLAVPAVPLLRSLCRRMAAVAAEGDSYAAGSVSAAFVTCPNEDVAARMARAMVEQKLAACVNIVPRVTSIYEWKGKVEQDSEVLLMIKTRTSRIPALTEFVRSAHPYEVPEVVAVPVAQGNAAYLQWVRDSVPPSSDPPTESPPQ